jgi:hypothetical protein
MGFSSRARLDVQRYVETEETKVKQQQQQKVDGDKAQVNQKVSRFWSQPLQVLKTLHDLRPEGSIDKCSGLTRTNETRTHEEQSTAFNTFIQQLEENGTTMNDDSQQRLVLYAIAQSEVFADLTLQENWGRALNRLQELRAFAEGDVVTVTKPVESQPQKPETLADVYTQLDQVSTQSREGTKAAKKLATLGLILEAQPIFQEFKSFMARGYDRIITSAEADRSITYLRENNLRLDDKRSWDVVRKKIFRCITREEQQLEEMDADAQALTQREFAVKYGLTKSGATIGF